MDAINNCLKCICNKVQQILDLLNLTNKKIDKIQPIDISELVNKIDILVAANFQMQKKITAMHEDILKLLNNEQAEV